jgi:g-D-glutamyl-meso-diaminopimelate peptidase
MAIFGMKMENICELKPLDYLETSKTISRLCDKYPFLIKGSIGKSVMGKDIYSLRIGTTNEYVLFAGAFHGREHITTSLLLKFCEDLCEALDNDESLEGLHVRRAMYGRGLIIIPTINPDRCEVSIHGRSGCGRNASFISRI